MKKLFGTSKDQMGADQKAVLLVSKVNESKRHGERGERLSAAPPEARAGC